MRMISFERVPDAARRAILLAAAGSDVLQIEEIAIVGGNLYMAGWLAHGQPREVVVSADGRIVGAAGDSRGGD